MLDNLILDIWNTMLGATDVGCTLAFQSSSFHGDIIFETYCVLIDLLLIVQHVIVEVATEETCSLVSFIGLMFLPPVTLPLTFRPLHQWPFEHKPSRMR